MSTAIERSVDKLALRKTEFLDKMSTACWKMRETVKDILRQSNESIQRERDRVVDRIRRATIKWKAVVGQMLEKLHSAVELERSTTNAVWQDGTRGLRDVVQTYIQLQVDVLLYGEAEHKL